VFRDRSQSITAAAADALVAEANALAISEGATGRVLRATQEAVKAARTLVDRVGARDDRRRLSTALWRRAATLAGRDQARDAVAPAREAIDLARQVLRETGPDDSTFDAIVGEFATHVADLAQVLAFAGHEAQARQLLEEGHAAAQRSDGPGALRGLATVLRIQAGFLVKDAAVRMEAGEQSAADSAHLVTSAQTMVELLRDLATEEDPTTILDLAQGLHQLSRASTIAMRSQPAADTLREAFAIFSCFDGPTARAGAKNVADELVQLSEAFPDVRPSLPPPDSWRPPVGRTPARTEPPPPTGRRARARAEVAPDTPAEADAAEAARRLASAADSELEDGMRLSREGRMAEAELALYRAMGQYALLMEEGDTGAWSRSIVRRCARAHARYAIVLHATGRAAQAMADGRRGVQVSLRLLDSLTPGTSEHTEVTAETATMMADLGEVAFAAGLPDEQFALLDDAVARCGDNRDPGVRRALGTVLHNRATAMLNAFVADVQTGVAPSFGLGTIDATVARGVTMREQLLDPSDGLSSWELANSLVLRSKVAAFDQKGGVAVDSLARAWALIAPLGGQATDDLRAEATRISEMLSHMQPGAVEQARAGHRWPF
jgi:hypothetical protein